MTTPQNEVDPVARPVFENGTLAAALTPAYREMQARMNEVVEAPLRLSEDESEDLIARYSKHGEPLARVAQDTERVNQKCQMAGGIKRSECSSKREVVQDRRVRWAQLTQPDRTGAIAPEKDIADACR